MRHLRTHESLRGIPDPWTKNEEYYYWENGYLDSNNIELLEVETTLGPNGIRNSYDSARAISWYKIDTNNARIFYTAMGHANSNYTADTLFINHIENATKWCLGIISTLDFHKQERDNIHCLPNPSKGTLRLTSLPKNANIQIFTKNGMLVMESNSVNNFTTLDLSEFKRGLYIIKIQSGNNQVMKKLVLN